MSEFAVKVLEGGIADWPTNPEWGVGELPSVPQTEEELAFGVAELEKGLASNSRLWEELGKDEVGELLEQGYMVSSAFVHWEGETKEGGRKGRFVQNFHRKSKAWDGCGVRMERAAEFATQIERGDTFLSFYIEAGYRHFFLAPKIRNFFLFSYAGRYFRCIALPFGWSRSSYWFVVLLKPFVGKLRRWDYRVLSYIDDFLVAPSVGRASTTEDCWKASSRIDGLMERLGLKRHQRKGFWGGGAQIVGHLGFRWDSVGMQFSILERKQEKVRAHAKKLLREASKGRRWVSRDSLRSFAGVAVSLHLALPLALFYSRSIYDAVSDFSEAGMPSAWGGKRTRLRGRAVKDLREWAKLCEEGRDFVDEEPSWAVHTDAAELGWGGTAGPEEGAGADGRVEASGVWTAEDRKESITLRELRAVSLVLGRGLGVEVQYGDVKRVRLYIDNQGAKCVIAKMTSKAPTLMRELRVLQRLLTRLGISLAPEWLPSAENYFADRLSRTWDPRDLKVRARVRKDVLERYAHVGLAEGGGWAYRPLGIHPVAMRKVTLVALGEVWGSERARLYCPPVDLISLTVLKIKREGARGVLLVPDWGSAPWMASVMALGEKFWVWEAGQGRDVWAGRRNVQSQWRLRVVEIGI